MTTQRIALIVFWLMFVGFIGPALFSHASYEGPIVGFALATAAVWSTYHLFFKRKKQ